MPAFAGGVHISETGNERQLYHLAMVIHCCCTRFGLKMLLVYKNIAFQHHAGADNAARTCIE